MTFGGSLRVGPSCEAAGSGSVILGRNKESCLADETTAQDTLKQNWPKYLATDRIDCVTLENSGGPASYVELLSVLRSCGMLAASKMPIRSIAPPRPSKRAAAIASRHAVEDAVRPEIACYARPRRYATGADASTSAVANR
jgi:hypothetical protein